VIRKKRFDLLPKKNSLKNGIRQKLRKRKNRAHILIISTIYTKNRQSDQEILTFLNSEFALSQTLHIEDYPISVPMGWGYRRLNVPQAFLIPP
jgi:hypothetical protein